MDNNKPINVKDIEEAHLQFLKRLQMLDKAICYAENTWRMYQIKNKKETQNV